MRTQNNVEVLKHLFWEWCQKVTPRNFHRNHKKKKETCFWNKEATHTPGRRERAPGRTIKFNFLSLKLQLCNGTTETTHLKSRPKGAFLVFQFATLNREHSFTEGSVSTLESQWQCCTLAEVVIAYEQESAAIPENHWVLFNRPVALCSTSSSEGPTSSGGLKIQGVIKIKHWALSNKGHTETQPCFCISVWPLPLRAQRKRSSRAEFLGGLWIEAEPQAPSPSFYTKGEWEGCRSHSGKLLGLFEARTFQNLYL